MKYNSSFTERTGFKLFLEGIEVPFSNITIRQAEGSFPQASINMVGTLSSLKILPDTKVLFTGEDPQEGSKRVVLFEGEIKSVSFQKSEGGRVLGLSCKSITSKWEKVSATPNDVMVSGEVRSAQGDFKATYINVNERNPSVNQVTRGLYEKYKDVLDNDLDSFESGLLKNALESELTSTTELMEQFASLKDGESTLETVVGYIFRKFEEYDLFYGLDAMSYKIPHSVLTMPNTDKLKPFVIKSAIEDFMKTSRRIKNPMGNNEILLFGAVAQFLQKFMYNFTVPSAPTSTQTFWSKFSGRSPVRTYMAPSLEHAPPAKFNVFYPHMVISTNYNRDFSIEPTRTICETDYTGVPGADTQLLSFSERGFFPFSQAPNLNINEHASETNRVGLTVEETYRGINVSKKPFDWFLSNIDPEQESPLLTQGAIPTTSDIDTINSKIKDPLNEYTVRQHYKSKLRGRSLNVQADWSPYRMCGVPGLIIGDEHSPSLIGTVAAITDSYQGSGGITSTITFRNIRVIHEEDDSDLLSDEERDALITEDTLDPFVDINSFLFNESLYGSKNIGESYYPVLMYGALYKGTEDLKKGFSEEYAAKIEEFASEEEVTEDCSILDVLQDKEYTDSVGYTSAIRKAVKIYKDRYYAREPHVKLMKAHTDKIVYRRLLSENEYKSFIGIPVSESFDFSGNYKNNINLFLGSEKTEQIINVIKEESVNFTPYINGGDIDLLNAEIESLKSDLESVVLTDEYKQEIQTRIEELTKEKEDLLAEEEGENFANEFLKPYVLTRKAHVKYALTRHIRENKKFESLLGSNYKLNLQS